MTDPTDFVVVAGPILPPRVLTVVGAGLPDAEWYEAHSHGNHHIGNNLSEVTKRELGKTVMMALGLLGSAAQWWNIFAIVYTPGQGFTPHKDRKETGNVEDAWRMVVRYTKDRSPSPIVLTDSTENEVTHWVPSGGAYVTGPGARGLTSRTRHSLPTCSADAEIISFVIDFTHDPPTDHPTGFKLMAENDEAPVMLNMDSINLANSMSCDRHQQGLMMGYFNKSLLAGMLWAVSLQVADKGIEDILTAAKSEAARAAGAKTG
eukprot:4848786-Pyramimonas_sp.AAC.1